MSHINAAFSIDTQTVRTYKANTHTHKTTLKVYYALLNVLI